MSLEGVQAIEGQYIALIDDKLSAASDSLLDVAEAVLRKANADKHELITLYYGDTVTKLTLELLRIHCRHNLQSQNSRS